MPDKVLLDDKGQCVLTREELEKLVEECTADESTRNRTKHTLQVTYPYPKTGRILDDEAASKTQTKTKAGATKKKSKILQILPAPPELQPGKKKRQVRGTEQGFDLKLSVYSAHLFFLFRPFTSYIRQPRSTPTAAPPPPEIPRHLSNTVKKKNSL